MRTIPLSSIEFTALLEQVKETKELFLSRTQPPPSIGDLIVYLDEDTGQMLTAQVRNLRAYHNQTDHLVDARILNHFPYGLKKPASEWLDSFEAADWLCMEPESFRMMGFRLGLERKTNHEAPTKKHRFRYLYHRDTVWMAALSTKTHGSRLIRINERERSIGPMKELLNA